MGKTFNRTDMKAEIKAYKLFNDVTQALFKNKCSTTKEGVKQCALLVVDEILEILTFDLGHDQTARSLKDEYEKVKFEIEKL